MWEGEIDGGFFSNNSEEPSKSSSTSGAKIESQEPFASAPITMQGYARLQVD
jgi:hypothetical protein